LPTSSRRFDIPFVDSDIYQAVGGDQAPLSADRRQDHPPSCVCGAPAPCAQPLAPARRVCGVRCTRTRFASTPYDPETHRDRHALSSPPHPRPAPTLLPLRRSGAACTLAPPSTPHRSTPPWPQVTIFGSFDISASRSSCWLPSIRLSVGCARMRFRELRGSCRRAAWVVRAAADPECRVFVNRGGRFVIFYY